MNVISTDFKDLFVFEPKVLGDQRGYFMESYNRKTLLEKGIDIKYIKDLLGHFSITTTNRYLHVKRESLVNIVSPLDQLYLDKELDF